MALTETLPAEFRQKCEGIATEQRSLLNLRAFEPLPADILAAQLNAKILTSEQIPSLDPSVVKILLDSDQWSAGIINQSPLWIVNNPRHTPARRESNLMHEFGHLLLRHKIVRFDPNTGLPLRRQSDEDEATYLGACLQIPRRGLLWAVHRQMTQTEIAVHFNASEEMVRFRSNVTGINIV
ncbi:ImmA/IrrE family metallo-endopeptidase [Nostoc punctiforme FACHB-252]|uniref:ImmA/IrrE family metallo-endopeptidase n=1 Tax=Nostoc punctiforme FACHB-252 TaxID=1357509 RepID=A0ABR8HH11_NOSPU|nr:ImmA/IrrE family metallo-endopeptidase [Nostoc punctiforme]MBD2614442.1 ImmA/IrrE family metallo-endopeptidase [Nostoc punctiforme FACHB-252]